MTTPHSKHTMIHIIVKSYKRKFFNIVDVELFYRLWCSFLLYYCLKVAVQQHYQQDYSSHGVTLNKVRVVQDHQENCHIFRQLLTVVHL